MKQYDTFKKHYFVRTFWMDSLCPSPPCKLISKIQSNMNTKTNTTAADLLRRPTAYFIPAQANGLGSHRKPDVGRRPASSLTEFPFGGPLAPKSDPLPSCPVMPGQGQSRLVKASQPEYFLQTIHQSFTKDSYAQQNLMFTSPTS